MCSDRIRFMIALCTRHPTQVTTDPFFPAGNLERSVEASDPV